MLLLWNSQSSFVSILISLVAYMMALFIAMPFHEFAHAFAAKREGDFTPVAYKRYSLAPFAHVDAMGLLMFVLFGFGWAKPIPVDERNFKRGKLSKFLVAISGITANLIIGTISLFIYVLLYKLFPGFYTSNLYGRLLSQFLQYSASLNFILLFFNILPIYPLDGFNIVSSIAGEDNGFVRFMSRASLVIYFILLLTGLLYIYYDYTAGLLIDGLFKLFTWMLGV